MNARSFSFRPRSQRAPHVCVNLRVGRLLEIRIAAPEPTGFDPRDDEPFENLLQRELLRAHGKVVVCSDYRDAPVLSSERAEDFNTLVRLVSPRVERSAVLLSQSQATFNMQLQRMVLSGATPVRRSFYDERDGLRWLGEALDPHERERLLAFVGTPRSPTSLARTSW